MAPYPGVKPGSETEKKIERCVNKVRAQNPSWDKSRAIATCIKSIKKEVGMSQAQKTRAGLTSRQRRKLQKRKRLTEKEKNQAPDIEALDELENIEEEIEELGLEDSEPLSEETAPEIIEEFPPDEEAIAAMQAEVEAEEIVEEIVEEEPEEELELVHDDEDFEFDEEELAEVTMEELVEELIELEEEEPEEEEKSFDYDLAYLDMLIKMDGNTPIEALKAKLTSRARKGLSDGDFAFVTTRDGKKVRKYPIHDKAHVRNALSRAAQ